MGLRTDCVATGSISSAGPQPPPQMLRGLSKKLESLPSPPSPTEGHKTTEE